MVLSSSELSYHIRMKVLCVRMAKKTVVGNDTPREEKRQQDSLWEIVSVIV
jgi:hypothetical protein